MNVELHEGQYRIWDEINKSQEKGVRHFVMNCPRQWGKTHLMKTLITYYGTNGDKGKKMMWISQYLKNARKIFSEVLEQVEGTPFLVKSNKTDLFIKFRNGSVIYFAGADNTKTIRGFSNEILFMDEFAHYANLEESWTKVIRPTTLAYKKSAMIFMISTPLGKNLFFDMCQKAKDENDTTYAYFSGSYTENPFVDVQEIEEARRDLPDEAFRQEYMAEFVDWDSSVFRNLLGCSTIENFEPPKYGDTYYAGVDWGRANDETVLIIMNQDGKVVYIWANKPGMDYPEIVRKVVLDLKRYRIKHAYIESNSVGDVLYDMVKKQINQVDSIHVNNDKKIMLVQQLQLAFESAEISIPTDKCYPKLINQLGYFTRDLTPGGKITYRAPYKKKDDHCMALMFCYHSFKKHKNSGMYVLI